MNDYGQLTDQDLVLMLKSSDHLAFTEIYDRYESLLYSYAYRKLQDREEAKDIIQEVFISLWNSRSQFALQSTLSGYLYRAVLNKVISAFRHKSITQEYISSFQEIITAGQNNADYLIREKDISAAIQHEISCLPEKMREIFELRRTAYLSNKQIATHLNLSEHTVATQMKRALKVLKERLNVIIFFFFFLQVVFHLR